MGNNIEKNHIARVTYEKTLRASPNQKGGEAASLQAFPAWGRGTASAVDRVLSYAEQMRLSFPYTTSCLSYHSHPIRPCGAAFPRGEGCDTRIPSSKKAAHHPCEPIRPQAPSSRAKPRDLYCTAAICTHALSLKRHLGASFFAFPSLTIYRYARKIPPLRPS